MKKQKSTYVIEFENQKAIGTDNFGDMEPSDIFYELMGDLENKYPEQVDAPEGPEDYYTIMVQGKTKFIIYRK